MRLLLTCRADAQPAPLAERALARIGLPGPRVLLALALAAIVALTAVRTGGSGGTALGAGQLVPTALCIALLGAFPGRLGLPPGRGRAGPAAALAVLAELDASPPARLAPELLVAGPRSMRAFVRAQRQAGTDATEVAVSSCARAARASCAATAHCCPSGCTRGSSDCCAAPRRCGAGARASPASAARRARWPAIAIEGDLDDLVELTLGLVRALDRELAERQVP